MSGPRLGRSFKMLALCVFEFDTPGLGSTLRLPTNTSVVGVGQTALAYDIQQRKSEGIITPETHATPPCGVYLCLQVTFRLYLIFETIGFSY